MNAVTQGHSLEDSSQRESWRIVCQGCLLQRGQESEPKTMLSLLERAPAIARLAKSKAPAIYAATIQISRPCILR